MIITKKTKAKVKFLFLVIHQWFFFLFSQTFLSINPIRFFLLTIELCSNYSISAYFFVIVKIIMILYYNVMILIWNNNRSNNHIQHWLHQCHNQLNRHQQPVMIMNLSVRFMNDWWNNFLVWFAWFIYFWLHPILVLFCFFSIFFCFVFKFIIWFDWWWWW